MSIKSKYAAILNALVSMQDSLIYAARVTVLRDAEKIIRDLEHKTEPKIEVQLIKYQGTSGAFSVRKEDRYKVVLYNHVTGQSRTVDNNDGWGWRRDRGISGAETWASFLNVKYVEYTEQSNISTQIVLKENKHE